MEMSIKSILIIQKYVYFVEKCAFKKFFSGQKAGQNKGSTQLQKMTAQKVK